MQTMAVKLDRIVTQTEEIYFNIKPQQLQTNNISQLSLNLSNNTTNNSSITSQKKVRKTRKTKNEPKDWSPLKNQTNINETPTTTTQEVPPRTGDVSSKRNSKINL
jgi:hypothetical protein